MKKLFKTSAMVAAFIAAPAAAAVYAANPQDDQSDIVTIDIEPMMAEPASEELNEDEPYPWPDFMNVTPVPGRYKMEMSLIAFDFQNDGELPSAMTPEMVEESFRETKIFCVAPGSTRSERWLGDIEDEDCTDLETQVGGNRYSHSRQCSHDDGTTIIMSVDGEVYPDRARMDVSVAMEDAVTGAVNVDLRIAANREGDCD